MLIDICNDVERAMLDFIVNASDVFAYDTKAYQLYTAEEQDTYDNRGPTRLSNVKDVFLHKDTAGVQERQ